MLLSTTESFAHQVVKGHFEPRVAAPIRQIKQPQVQIEQVLPGESIDISAHARRLQLAVRLSDTRDPGIGVYLENKSRFGNSLRRRARTRGC